MLVLHNSGECCRFKYTYPRQKISDKIIGSVGLIIERLKKPNTFFESISSDLSYCCIGDFNETGILRSVA